MRGTLVRAKFAFASGKTLRPKTGKRSGQRREVGEAFTVAGTISPIPKHPLISLLKASSSIH